MQLDQVAPTHEPAVRHVAFDGGKRIASGAPAHVALSVKRVVEARPLARVMVFDAVTGEQIDFDHRGTAAQVLRRRAAGEGPTSGPAQAAGAAPEAPAGPGRPRLGVVAREVTLLPRHWQWLSSQPGGASVALRRLVDQARRDRQGADRVRQSQEACYRFMSAMAGDLTGFEEAARALFAADQERFRARLAPWPPDIRTELERLAAGAFELAAKQNSHHG